MTVAELLAELVALGLNRHRVEYREIKPGVIESNDHEGYFVMECVVCRQATMSAVVTTNTCGRWECMTAAGEPVDKNVYHDA